MPPLFHIMFGDVILEGYVMGIILPRCRVSWNLFRWIGTGHSTNEWSRQQLGRLACANSVSRRGPADATPKHPVLLLFVGMLARLKFGTLNLLVEKRNTHAHKIIELVLSNLHVRVPLPQAA